MFQQELAQAAQRVNIGGDGPSFDAGQGSMYDGSGLAGMPAMGSAKPPGMEKFSHE